MKKLAVLVLCSLGVASVSYSQGRWRLGGNGPIPAIDAPNATNNILGTATGMNFPLRIATNGIERAIFTTNATLTSWSGNAGDGLSILAPPGMSGNLDLFTSGNVGQNETHARFGNSGQVSGQNNRFEFISTGAQLGNYYSTFSIQGIHRFDRGETECAPFFNAFSLG